MGWTEFPPFPPCQVLSGSDPPQQPDDRGGPIFPEVISSVARWLAEVHAFVSSAEPSKLCIQCNQILDRGIVGVFWASLAPCLVLWKRLQGRQRMWNITITFSTGRRVGKLYSMYFCSQTLLCLSYTHTRHTWHQASLFIIIFLGLLN